MLRSLISQLRLIEPHEAREMLNRFPAGDYATIVEHWRQLDDGKIKFTMRRLPSAD